MGRVFEAHRTVPDLAVGLEDSAHPALSKLMVGLEDSAHPTTDAIIQPTWEYTNMRRRSGFTLVEVLVAMALILFIMTILAAAFGTATQAVSDLKSAGDLAERLRGATTVIHRDLEANHCFDSNGNVLRLSSMWNTNNGLNPNPPPPAQGFFRIYEGSPATLEGTDINGLSSYYQTTAALAYTISLTGTQRNDFLSALVARRRSTTIPPIR